MSARVASLVLSVAVLAGVVLLVLAYAIPIGTAPIHRASAGSEPMAIPDTSLPIQSWARGAPFRRNRVATPQSFDAQRAVAQAEAASLTRPHLVLKGLVLGKVRAAVIEGLPGIEGAKVLRPGEEQGGVRVIRIDGQRVVARAGGTMIELRIGTP